MATADRALPEGTVTLLFTDIEGSTALLRGLGRNDYVAALNSHRKIVRAAVESVGGVEIEMQGDSFFFAFSSARAAASAAAEAQLRLAQHEWQTLPILVRMGLHTGEPDITGDRRYAGLDIHRAARIMSIGHGGQILLSPRTADLVEGDLPPACAHGRSGPTSSRTSSAASRSRNSRCRAWARRSRRSRRRSLRQRRMGVGSDCRFEQLSVLGDPCSLDDAAPAGPLGRFGFDQQGDPKIGAIGVIRIENGSLSFERTLYPNASFAKSSVAVSAP